MVRRDENGKKLNPEFPNPGNLLGNIIFQKYVFREFGTNVFFNLYRLIQLVIIKLNFFFLILNNSEFFDQSYEIFFFKFLSDWDCFIPIILIVISKKTWNSWIYHFNFLILIQVFCLKKLLVQSYPQRLRLQRRLETLECLN